LNTGSAGVPAGALGISVKTADRHVQNAYRKIGLSTRAAATLFAM
jgi:DNA-binding CsgD family transcriptional regulator